MSRNTKQSLCLINRRHLTPAIALLVTLAAGQTAHADLVIAPISAVINTGQPGSGDIADTFNQTGLSTGYTSGVTDFDAYIASNPLHSTDAGEWFSNSPAPNPTTVTYNLGSAFTINRLALWNEEGSGIATLDLLSSTNGVDYAPLDSGLMPTDNPSGAPYPAQVFSFTATSAQFIRFLMTGPQDPFDFNAVGIGEVAFSQVQSTGVPEPSSLALLGLAACGFGIGAYRRKQARPAGNEIS